MPFLFLDVWNCGQLTDRPEHRQPGGATRHLDPAAGAGTGHIPQGRRYTGLMDR